MSKPVKKQTETNSASANAAVTRAAVASKQGKRPAPKNVKLKRESGTMKFQGRIREAIGDDNEMALGRRFRVTLIREGLGNLQDCFFYTKEAIASMVPLFEGAQARANHQTARQDEERPEGDVMTVFGYYENVQAELADDGCTELNADLVICDGPAFDRERGLMRESVTYSQRHKDKSFIGLSINAGGDFDTTTFEDFMTSYPIPVGASAKIQEALSKGLRTIYPTWIMTMADSCDLVTVAGAGGRVNQVLESNKERQMPAPKKAQDQQAEDQQESEEKQGQQEGAEDGAEGGDAQGSDQPGGDDADQDQELILQMLKKYLGDGFTDEQKEAASSALKTAKASGMDDDEAMKCAGYHMKMSVAQAKGKNPQGVQNPPVAQQEAVEESEQEESDKKPPVKESGKKAVSDVVKLHGRIAALEAELGKRNLDEHIEKAMKESKLPMNVTKKFRECVKDVKTAKEFDEKFSLFKEGFGQRGEAGSEFVVEAEKTTGAEGEAGEGLDFSDCKVQ